MHTIDASMGEGGGQMLRLALSISAITGEPVKVENIRKKRPRPGLKAQHLTAARALSQICDADIEGAHIGSTELYFEPRRIRGGRYVFDTGTAGSITLMIQALLPVLLMADSPSEVVFRGGTDVKWSPPADHTKNVLLPVLERMGALVDMEIVRRGYYPEGGGEVLLKVEPSKLKGISLAGGWPEKIEGVAHCSNLPEHVPRRMKHAAIKELMGMETRICADCRDSASTGAGLMLWSKGDGYAIGGSALGERGLPSEKVGKMAALSLKKGFGYGVDEHLADQLLIYFHLAGEGSMLAPELTGHAESAIKLIEMMTDSEFSVKKENGYLIEKKA